MNPQAHVLHHTPKPIALHEFRDAVLATCRPRFPTARYARPQRIALAISGGVDSMAMAFLFSSLLSTYRGIRIADNPATSAYGIVVDHRLREESTAEALQVSQELKKLGIKPFIRSLNWRDLRSQGLEPGSMPNVESLARVKRYRSLGNACRYLQTDSLFFAHHSDDQYETVLMRLLAGHGYRGLQGIRAANAIPECYELHGVYKSGLLDDQMRKFPFLSFKPPAREMKKLRVALRDAKDAEPWDQIKTYLGVRDKSRPPSAVRGADAKDPYLTPLHSEDGGVMIYRPLLEFDKDRLRATCEANNVPWFEDGTNRDPSLTPRNAIRYLTRSHELPRALQKPSVLALAARSRARWRLQEAEAQRMLVREAVIKAFDPNAGTLLVEMPTFRRGPSRRWLDEAREAARRPRRRTIAAIAIRKLIEFVTPERHLPPLASMEHVVDRLCPGLDEDKDQNQDVKSFSLAGVVFEPVGSSRRSWFLSRAPYVSNQPLPERKLPGYLNCRHGALGLGREDEDEDEEQDRRGHWRSWKTAKIWDGRFWIRVSACVAAKFQVLPFMPAYSKPFRMALPRAQRERLEGVLRRYAPGKVRYSLPALYSVEGGEGEEKEANPVLTLLALPSLGMHVPGLERWVRYEARYRQVDVSLVGSDRRGRMLSAGRAQRSKSRYRRGANVSGIGKDKGVARLRGR